MFFGKSSLNSGTRRLLALSQTVTFKRRLRFWAGAWLSLLVFYLVTNTLGIIRWHVQRLPPNYYPESSVFLQVRNSDTYLYSAVTNMAPPGASHSVTSVKGKDSGAIPNIPADGKNVRAKQSYQYITQELGQDLEIVITGLDRSRSWASSFVCCVKMGGDAGGGSDGEDGPIFATTAATYFEYVKPITWEKWIKEYWLYSFEPSLYVATQYSCRIPRKYLSSSKMPAFATLAPMPSTLARTLSPLLFLSLPGWLVGYEGYCPRDTTEYVSVEYPERAPSGLGLCSKVNHNGPESEVVLEWLELQRHLGVDRVVVYDMGDNSPELNRVFSHYEKVGLVERQPYDLPGDPRGRSLEEEYKHTAQFNQDETLAVLECRVRLSGHAMVLSMDKDEVLVPRRDVPLKSFLQDLFSKHPSAASLIFPTQFFLTTWLPSNPEEEVIVLRYRRTRIARWECWKYVFLPAKVKAAVTHEVFPVRGFSPGDRLPETEAILHHYRACPKDTWGTCEVSSTVDNTMTRYKDALTIRIKEARAAIAAEHMSPGDEADYDQNGSVRED
ncbi:hypothetical protein ElyMa_001540100 [Elysia marginata]|uniref:Glycosyltransferase family 92 protein n=1 Tax=Elysia marginata TaxID=1093978 RepID=A0AAV4J8S4_9GAST|nr:hypothetical protein ElyMa_001540100 [Elysia marginata]